MVETLTYIGLYFLLAFVNAILLFFLVIGVTLFLSLWLRVISEKTAINIFLLSLALCPLIVSALPYYTLAKNWKYYPPFPKLDSLEQAEETQKELKQLQGSIKNLLPRLNDPKKLTFGELEVVLTDSLDLTGKLQTVTEQQGQTIHSLRQTIDEERTKAEVSRQLGQEANSLKQEEIERVKAIMGQDAKTEFLLGVLVSFLIGIVSSLLATWIYRRFGRKAKAVITLGQNP
jgi:hypothetical protein